MLSERQSANGTQTINGGKLCTQMSWVKNNINHILKQTIETKKWEKMTFFMEVIILHAASSYGA